MSSRFSLLVLITCGLIGLSVDARPPDDDFFDAASFQEVELEVFVTDRQNIPVRDLTAADFRVFDEGEEVTMTHFALADRDATANSNSGAFDIVLFFDTVSIPNGRLSETLDTLRQSPWLRRTQKDRLMVASHSGDQAIEIIQPLTSNPEVLRRALDAVGRKTNENESTDQLGYLELVQQILTLDGRGSPKTAPEDELLKVARALGSQVAREREALDASLKALSHLIDSLAGLPGPTAIIYVTGGLLESPGLILAEAFRDRLRGSAKGLEMEHLLREKTFTARWQDLAQRAKGNRVTFYPLLTGGGPEKYLSSFDIEPEARTPKTRMWNQPITSLLKATLEGQVTEISKATGGFPLPVVGSDPVLMDQLFQQTDSHYRLRFQAPRFSDGSSHQLTVRLQDRSLTARHRRGYCDKTPDRSLHDLTVSALLFDLDNNELGIKVEAGRGVAREGKILVPVTVRFPYDRLLLLPEETYHQGQVTIYVGTRDASGRTTPMTRVPGPIRIANDKLLSTMAKEVTFRLDLPLPKGQHSLVVGVRDELAAVEATTRVALNPTR